MDRQSEDPRRCKKCPVVVTSWWVAVKHVKVVVVAKSKQVIMRSSESLPYNLDNAARPYTCLFTFIYRRIKDKYN